MTSAVGRGGPAIAVSILLVTFASLPQFLFGALSPLLVRDLNVPISSVAVALLALNVVAVALSPFSGRLVDRIGVAASALMCLTAVSLGLVMLVLSPQLSWPLWAPAGVLGVSASLSQPVTNVVLMAALRPGQRGVGFGLKQAATPLAGLIAGASLPLAAEVVGWRLVVGGFALAAATLAAIVVRLLRVTGEAATSRIPTVDPARPGVLSARLIGVVLATTCASGAYVASYTFFAILAVSRGLTLSASGTALVVGSVAAVMARVALGILADRRVLNLFRVTGIVMLLGAVAMAAVGHAPTVVLTAAMAMLGATAWAWNGLLHLAVATTYEHTAATATGLLQVGILGGAGLGPVVFAWGLHHGSLDAVWLAMSGILAGAAVAFLVLSSHSTPGRGLTGGSPLR